MKRAEYFSKNACPLQVFRKVIPGEITILFHIFHILIWVIESNVQRNVKIAIILFEADVDQNFKKMYSTDLTQTQWQFIKSSLNFKERKEEVVGSILEHTTQHGAIKGKKQETSVKYYNLDVIIFTTKLMKIIR